MNVINLKMFHCGHVEYPNNITQGWIFIFPINPSPRNYLGHPPDRSDSVASNELLSHGCMCLFELFPTNIVGIQ